MAATLLEVQHAKTGIVPVQRVWYKMSENEVDLAEIRLLAIHLAHRARICYAMVGAGIICLGAGVAMLVAGLSGDQVVWFQSGNLKITAGGFGAVTMVASVAWGYVAYKSRPSIDYNSPFRGISLTAGELRSIRRAARHHTLPKQK